MEPGHPSRTLLRSAIRRASHQLLDNPVIFHDPIIAGLVPEAADPAIRNALDDEGAPPPKVFRYLFALRNRFAEDRLAQAAARGARQYLILGAGLDTFAWRQPSFGRNLRIFAADHPASLAWTQQRLRERGLAIPPNLTFVPVDLESRRVGDALTACGFDPGQMSFCSMLGVTQYLSGWALRDVLGFAAALGASSEIVFTFVPPDDDLNADDIRGVTHSMARTASLGEPWKTRIGAGELTRTMRALGFSDILHLTPDAAIRSHLADHHNIGNAPGWEQFIAAVV